MIRGRHYHLRKVSLWIMAAIVVVWVAAYQVVITGAFSRSFWASIIGVHHSATMKHPIEKLTLKK